MIPLSKPAMGPKALKYVQKAFHDNQIAQGPFVHLLEANFAKYRGLKYATACSNGTMALFLALRALDIEDGEVIMPTLTFAATADAVLMAGAKPVFCDIDPETWSLDENSVKKRITKNTRAIISVDLYGVVSVTHQLRQFYLPIIRDAAESLGAKPSDQEVDFTCYSFFGNKVMTSGEGGMVLTNNQAYKNKMDMLRNHGRIKGFWHELRGTNARMSNITAAIGLSQLEDLPKNLKKREQIIKWYKAENIYIPVFDKNIAPWVMIYNTHTIFKDMVVKYLSKHHIEARPGFSPLHVMPAYYQNVDLPISQHLGDRIVLLPCFPDLKRKQVKYICKLLGL